MMIDGESRGQTCLSDFNDFASQILALRFLSAEKLFLVSVSVLLVADRSECFDPKFCFKK